MSQPPYLWSCRSVMRKTKVTAKYSTMVHVTELSRIDHGTTQELSSKSTSIILWQATALHCTALQNMTMRHITLYDMTCHDVSWCSISCTGYDVVLDLMCVCVRVRACADVPVQKGTVPSQHRNPCGGHHAHTSHVRRVSPLQCEINRNRIRNRGGGEEDIESVMK